MEQLQKKENTHTQIKKQNNTVVALIAAYNESDRISDTIKAIKEIPIISRILVVDDGSVDDTANIAALAGAEVIRLEQNMGKGGALGKALDHIKEDLVLFLDADLGSCAKEAIKLVEPVLAGEADMAIADFPKPKKKGGFGLAKGLGRWGIKYFTGIEMNEPLSGQRAVKSIFLKDIKFESGYGLEVGMTIDILKQGCRVIEIPVNMTHRETGRDLAGILHRGKQFRDIVKVLLKRLFR